MVKTVSAALVCLILYGIIIIPFTIQMRSKPFVEKLGEIPSVTALKAVAADHKELLAASLVLKVLMYFGDLVDKANNKLEIPPDFMSMSRLLHGAVQLDPYNMDAYYFAQSFLSWDARQFKVANELLDYGMKYRTWDWQLPFFAGFNSSYFMKDYAAAARYFKRAGELSDSDLPKLLAGRYMQESGQTDLAIAYLLTMEKGVVSYALKKLYLTRLIALKEVKRIEMARDHFRESRGLMPVSIEQLISSGFLSQTPVDPYGGQFYIELDGKVATTSKFAFAGVKK